MPCWPSIVWAAACDATIPCALSIDPHVSHHQLLWLPGCATIIPGTILSAHGIALISCFRLMSGTPVLCSLRVDFDVTGSNSSRVTPERVAELLGAAIYHNAPEVWVARHPVLALAYVMRFFPSLGWLAFQKVGPKRARALKEGRSGYDVSGILNDSKKAA